MKKTVIKIIIAAVLVAAVAVLATVLIIHFQNKPFKNKVVDSLPEYESASIYTNEGDSELIKYGRYVYTGVTEETLSSNGYLKKIGLDELDLIAIDSLIDSVERFDLMLGKLYEKTS